MKSLIKLRTEGSVASILAAADHLSGRIAKAAQVIIEAYKSKHGIFLFGNGGSAADAQHIAGEMQGRFLQERRPLKAQSLSTDPSVVTCIANDYSYDVIFSRQLEANGYPGDVAIGLSTSGNSQNVILALKQARQMGMKTIAFTGEGGGKCVEIVDVLLDVPSNHTPYVQQAHMVTYHILCELVEQEIAKENL